MNWRNQHISNLLAILISGLLAWTYPLYTFILAYAYLGPLHYLTELAWLDKKNYFHTTKSRGLIYFFSGYILCGMLFIVLCLKFNISQFFILIALALALQVITHRIYAVLLLILGLIAVIYSPGYALFFGLLVPTVIHVYVFTVLFMLTGAMRENSNLGYLNVILMLFAPLLALFPSFIHFQLDSYWIKALNGFSGLNMYLEYLLQSNTHPSKIFDTTAIPIVRFLGFIYLYHYLNWFLKTGLLEWHKLSKASWIIILLIYLASSSLYFYDFRLGFYALFYLSMLHVLMEFPLNWITIKYLCKQFTANQPQD